MESSGVVKGVWGHLPSPHSCQYNTRDFLKIDEKIGGGQGSSKSSEKQRAWPKYFHLCPLTFIAGATPLVERVLAIYLTIIVTEIFGELSVTAYHRE